MNDSDTTQLVDRPVNISDFAHLLWMAGGLAFVSVLLYVAIKTSQQSAFGMLIVGLLVTLALAAAFVGSVWAVFGPGSYLKRLIWAHLLVGIVGLGHLAGFTLMAWGDVGFELFSTLIQYILFGVAGVSFAAQIPLWFFRLFFGLQFTFRSSPPVESFSLRDIFVFTFLVAIGFAGAQMAANLAMPKELIEEMSDVGALDGALELERTVRFDMLFRYATVGLWSFGISLLSLPIVPLTFRTKELGCLLTAAYTFVLFVLLVLICSILTMWFFVGAIAIIGIYAGMVSIALTASRKQGFQLTSPRRFSRESTAHGSLRS